MTVRTPGPGRFETGSSWALLVSLTGVLISAVVIYTGHWRKGAMVLAAAVMAAGLMRLLLPERIAGQLVVRAKWVDCLILIGSAVAIAALVMVVKHSQPV